MSETVTIGPIDREACAGCMSEHKFLSVCCTPYVDLSSACVTCDSYRARTDKGREDPRSGLCVECGHYLSAFRTCAIGLPKTCNRNWPNARCRLTPSKWIARAEKA